MVARDPNEIVADTSIVGRIILREEGWREVLEAVKDKYIHVVDFQISEIGNLLWKRKDLDEETAIERYHEALLFVDEVHKASDIFEEAIRIAKRHSLPFYDSAVLALSKRLSVPLYTSDKTQAGVGRALGLSVALFL